MIEDVMKIKDRVNAIPLRKLKMKLHSRISYLLVDVEMSTIVQKGEKLLGIAAYLTLVRIGKHHVFAHSLSIERNPILCPFGEEASSYHTNSMM